MFGRGPITVRVFNGTPKTMQKPKPPDAGSCAHDAGSESTQVYPPWAIAVPALGKTDQFAKPSLAPMAGALNGPSDFWPRSVMVPPVAPTGVAR